MHWDYEERDWKRLVDKQGYKEANNPEIHGYQVALKSSSKFDENKLNEWKLHLQCQREALSNNTSLIPLLGITQDPYTLNYMIIMPNASLGNLRNNLSIKKENPNDKFYNLWDISKQLEAIHKLNLVHGNFYNENLLCATHDSIGDRPEIIEGTIPEYIELMKRCWDNDPEKRPTANELINIFYKWSKKYPIERNDEKRIPASVRTESYGLPDTKMTLAESEVRTSDFDLSSKKKFGKKIMLQKVKNKPMTIRLPKPMDTNTDYRRRIDSILELCKKATNHHVDLVKDLKQGHSFPYATRIFKETSSSLHKPNFQKDKLGRGKKDRL
ncbi:uncharacterized protein OCT59_007895 [Rhizophagus irregularis]|uniref:uncharacterized protein n=1 Tax=Rhizophagus irregularis TaxID=588596 RepID=UPI0033226C6A|nr:hypothetical protein OCT59_007895 [Rhizophagus irregularis]